MALIIAFHVHVAAERVSWSADLCRALQPSDASGAPGYKTRTGLLTTKRRAESGNTYEVNTAATAMARRERILSPIINRGLSPTRRESKFELTLGSKQVEQLVTLLIREANKKQ